MYTKIAAVGLGVAFTVTATAGTASARPVTNQNLLSSAEVTSVYPAMHNENPVVTRYRSVTAPAARHVGGHLKCDAYQRFRGVAGRDALFSHNVTNNALIDVDEDVVRFRTARRAEDVVRQYRAYVRSCRGTHATDDGEGGKATMKVRSWSPPRIGASSVGMLDAFIQHGETTWHRTIVSRVGRTITIVEVSPPSGTGTRRQAIRVTRTAVDKAA